MTNNNIVLIGGPDSGKTNFLARLWEALRSGEGVLVAPEIPSNIQYVEDSLAHLLQGEFAPRSDKSFNEHGPSFSIPVVSAKTTDANPVQIVVPDVSGELWKEAVETYELPAHWMEKLREAFGALLFIRIGSKLNNDPLDWVATAKLLNMKILQIEENADNSLEIPTAVQLCELLRFLENDLADKKRLFKPRVAVLVTAWDRLDKERAKLGPMAYLAKEYPLLAGRLADMSKLNVKVFGMSIVGGDFTDNEFKQKFFDCALNQLGYVVHETEGHVQTEHDVTIPISWVLEGLQDT